MSWQKWKFPSYPVNWREISAAVKRRDGYRCTDCGEANVTLNAHHIRSLSRGGTNDLTNLKTLCESCHARYHPHMQRNSRVQVAPGQQLPPPIRHRVSPYPGALTVGMTVLVLVGLGTLATAFLLLRFVLGQKGGREWRSTPIENTRSNLPSGQLRKERTDQVDPEPAEAQQRATQQEAEAKRLAEEAWAMARREEARKRPVAELGKALKEGESQTRVMAAEILGERGAEGAEAVPDLSDALQDQDTEVRRQATIALGLIGPPGKAALPALIATGLKDADECVRVAAARAILRVGPPSRNALKEIVEGLGDSNPEVCSAVEAVLNELSPFGKEDVPILCACLKNPQVVVRAYAAGALEKMGQDAIDGTAAVTELLQDSDSGIRGTAASTLGKIGPQARSAIPALVLGLTDRDRIVRQKAIKSLAKMGTDQETVSALIEGLKNDQENVAEIAEKALDENKLLTLDHIPALVEVLKTGKSKARLFTISTLGRMGSSGKEAISSLVEVLQDLDSTVREQAAIALGRIGPRSWKAAGELGKALTDENSAVQNSAALALVDIGPDAFLAAPNLVGSLRMKSLHDLSARALVKMGKNCVPTLITSLIETNDYRVRMDLISILAQIGPEASEAIPILATISTEAQLTGVRKAARSALEKIQGKK
jgi:HEAT repeat protein